MKEIILLFILACVFLLGCVENNVQKIDQPQGEAGEIREVLGQLGYEKLQNAVVEPVANTTQTLTKNYPPVNWRVSADLPGIKANFFLPGNSTIAFKKAIIEAEQKNVREFVDNCTQLGYKNIKIETTPLDKPSNVAQTRRWNGFATIAVFGKQVTVSISNTGSSIRSQNIGFADVDKYLSERTALLGYLNAFNQNSTVRINVGDIVDYAYYAGIAYTYNPESGSFAAFWEDVGRGGLIKSGLDCWNRTKFNNAQMWLTVSCDGMMSPPQIEETETALVQKGYLFTFLQS